MGGHEWSSPGDQKTSKKQLGFKRSNNWNNRPVFFGDLDFRRAKIIYIGFCHLFGLGSSGL